MQVGTEITGAPADRNDAGLVSFDDTQFVVDGNGFVQLVGGGPAIDTITGDGGGAIAPDGASNFNFVGTTVANATNAKPLFFDGAAVANTQTLELQVSTEITGAPADFNDAGLSSFDDTQFTVTANGYVQLIGGSMAIDSNTGDDAVVVFPDAGANFNWIGVTVANATNAKPIFFNEEAISNALNLDVQVATEITGSPGDKNDAGLSSYNDTQFVANADGYVSLVGGTDLPSIQTLTGDSGGALGPDASGNINILGGPGVTVTGAGTTLTVNSVVYTDHGVGATVATDSGSFSTAAITLTVPVSPTNGERVEFIAASGVLVIQMSGTQIAHLAGAATSAGGTITGSATGDFLSLIFQSSTHDWWSISSGGVWILA